MASWERNIYENQAMEHDEALDAETATTYTYVQISRDKPFKTVQATLINSGATNAADYIVYGSNLDTPGDPGGAAWFVINSEAAVAQSAQGHATVNTCARNVAIGYKSASGTTVSASITGV